MGTSEATSASAAGTNDAAGTTPAVVTNPPVVAPSIDATTLATYRQAIVAANPRAIPELIAGNDFAAVNASLEGARSAFERIATAMGATAAAGASAAGGGGTGEAVAAAGGVQSGQPAQTAPPVVPAGGAGTVVNVDKLSPEAKIRVGIEQAAKARP